MPPKTEAFCDGRIGFSLDKEVAITTLNVLPAAHIPALFQECTYLYFATILAVLAMCHWCNYDHMQDGIARQGNQMGRILDSIECGELVVWFEFPVLELA